MAVVMEVNKEVMVAMAAVILVAVDTVDMEEVILVDTVDKAEVTVRRKLPVLHQPGRMDDKLPE